MADFKDWSDSKKGTFVWRLFKDVLDVSGKRRQLGIVGFYLSKFGNTAIEKRFENKDWKEIYSLFVNRLGSPDKIDSFCNSLKNVRDSYDGYHDNGREGWKEKSGEPKKLSGVLMQVFEKYQNHDEEKLWKIVSNR